MSQSLPPYLVISADTVDSGVARHVVGMARELARRGHPTTLLEAKEDFVSRDLAGSAVRFVHHRLPEDGPALGLYRTWHAALAPYAGARAVLHRGEAGECSAAILWALRRRMARLYTIDHNPPPPQGRPYWPAPPGALWRLKWRLRCRLAAGLIDRSIAVSENVRTALRQHYHVPAERVVTCPNWVNVTRYAPDEADRQSLRRELGCDDGVFLVGSLNRLDPQKRPELLLAGFAQFAAQFPGSARLVMVGQGPSRPALDRLVQELHLAGRVHIAGYVDDPARYHRAFDLEVLTSSYEGGPITMLEAMASGCPYLATPVGMVPECLEHERTGWCAPLDSPEDVAHWLRAIAQLDPARRREVGARARQRVVEHYSPDVCLARLCAALDAGPAI